MWPSHALWDTWHPNHKVPNVPDIPQLLWKAKTSLPHLGKWTQMLVSPTHHSGVSYDSLFTSVSTSKSPSSGGPAPYLTQSYLPNAQNIVQQFSALEYLSFDLNWKRTLRDWAGQVAPQMLTCTKGNWRVSPHLLLGDNPGNWPLPRCTAPGPLNAPLPRRAPACTQMMYLPPTEAMFTAPSHSLHKQS